MSAAESARELMPWAVAVGGLSEIGLALILSLGLGSLALAVARPRAGRLRLDWPERARFTWPARKSAALAQLFLPLLVGALVPVLGGPLVPWSRGQGIALLVGLSWAVMMALRLRFERRLHPRPEAFSPRRFVLGRWAFLVVMYGHLMLLLVLAGLVAMSPSWTVWPALLAAVALILTWSRGAGVDLMGHLGMAHPAGPELTEIVRQRSERLGLEPRPVTVLDWEGANAFAFPLAQRLVFTTGALECLGAEQLAGVADHELGHLTEGRGVLLARTASALAYAPLVALAPVTRLAGFVGPLLLLGLAILISAATGRMRRRMEERADEHAHAEDGPAYGLALEALYRHNRAPAVLGKGPHPDLADRMKAAGVEPSWPIPEPPSKWTPQLGLIVAALASLLIVPLRVGLLALSWMGGPLSGLWGGPDWNRLAGDAAPEPALVLYAAALEDHPGDEESLAGSMQALARLGRCEEAWELSPGVPEWWVEPWMDLRDRCP
jgi:Zn-dependent protease with chaperone function